MDKAAAGICRKLLSAILQSEAAKAKYTPKPGERNAGTKSIDVVSMFGPVGTISRTYYYDKANRRGHYPWDEQMGLVGRYTPALVEEVARAAEDAPYKKAADEFARAYHLAMSGDTMQHIVELLRAELTSFVKLSDLGPKEDAKGEIDVVYVLADGTGLPFRRNALKGVRGKNGKAKTREVKLGVIFIGGVDSEGRPFRLQDTTTYVATTHRWGKFMKLLRAEFDRRFGKMPKRVVFLSDGGKWLKSVKLNEFPFATAILDFYHATEHLEPVLVALGLKKGRGNTRRSSATAASASRRARSNRSSSRQSRHARSRSGRRCARRSSTSGTTSTECTTTNTSETVSSSDPAPWKAGARRSSAHG